MASFFSKIGEKMSDIRLTEEFDDEEELINQRDTYSDTIKFYREKLFEGFDEECSILSGNTERHKGKRFSIKSLLGGSVGLVLLFLLLTGKFDNFFHRVSNGAYGSADNQYVISVKDAAQTSNEDFYVTESNIEDMYYETSAEDKSEVYESTDNSLENEDYIYCRTYLFEGDIYSLYLTVNEVQYDNVVGTASIGYIGDIVFDYPLYAEEDMEDVWYFYDENGKNTLDIYDDYIMLFWPDCVHSEDTLLFVEECGVNGEINYKGTSRD